MNCQNNECDIQQGWIRSRVLSRPGFYLESEWYCGEACLQQAIVERLKKRKQAREKSFQALLRLKLGHILLENGAITRAQLDKAIETQQKQQPSEKLGSILKTLEFVKERDVTLALSRQYGLPLVNLKNQKISDVVIKMVPLEIVRESTFFPLEYDSFNNALVLVTYDPADISNMINLRSILKCEVTIYLGDESVVRELKESFCRRAADQVQQRRIDGSRDCRGSARLGQLHCDPSQDVECHNTECEVLQPADLGAIYDQSPEARHDRERGVEPRRKANEAGELGQTRDAKRCLSWQSKADCSFESARTAELDLFALNLSPFASPRCITGSESALVASQAILEGVINEQRLIFSVFRSKSECRHAGGAGQQSGQPQYDRLQG